MCGGTIIAEFLPRTGHKLISAFLWPELHSYDLTNRECSCIIQNDETLLRFVKRTRIASQSPCSSCTPLLPHQPTGWSLNAEISNKGRENHYNNSRKRKLCDCSVNLPDNLEYYWPILTKSSDEEDSHETLDTSSDSNSDSRSDSDADSSSDSDADSSSDSDADSSSDSSLDSSSDSETYSGPS